MNALILRIGAFDRRLLHALLLRRRRWLTRGRRLATHVGDAPVTVGVAGFLLIGGVAGWSHSDSAGRSPSSCRTASLSS